MKFRKKPVVIEAVQWKGGNEEEIGMFAGQKVSCAREYGNFILLVHTLEGTLKADRGDWIIKGVKGEFYPCKPDVFEQTYEIVE